MDRALLTRSPALALLLVACGKDGADSTVPSTLTAPGSQTTTATCGPGVAAVNGPAAYSTVGEALAAASQDDTVQICPGTWSVEEGAGTGRITVEGATGDPADVTLLPGSSGSILRFFSSTRIRVSHLTLRDATRSALTVADVADFAVENCVFVDNTSDVAGGAIAAQVHRDPTVPKNLRVSNSRFDGNLAPQGGAIELSPRGGASLWIEDSQFTGNGADRGGAVYLLPIDGADNGLFVENTTFADNSAVLDGGAVAFVAPGEVRWTDVVATGNSAGNAGGAWVLLPGDGPGDARLERGRIAGNTAGNVLSGAVHLEPGWVLAATSAELGDGPDENVPKDVNVCGDIDGVASFTVGPGGCQ